MIHEKRQVHHLQAVIHSKWNFIKKHTHTQKKTNNNNKKQKQKQQQQVIAHFTFFLLDS